MSESSDGITLILDSASSFPNTTRLFTRTSSRHRARSHGSTIRTRMRKAALGGLMSRSRGYRESQFLIVVEASLRKPPRFQELARRWPCEIHRHRTTMMSERGLQFALGELMWSLRTIAVRVLWKILSPRFSCTWRHSY